MKKYSVYLPGVVLGGILAAGMLAGQTAVVDGVLTETAGGSTHKIKIDATQLADVKPGPHEDDHHGGGGQLQFSLRSVLGGNITSCSVRGPNPALFPAGDGFTPLTSVVCGMSYGQTVNIDGCTVRASVHGYVHSDQPRINYLGTTTIDITIHKAGPNASADLAIHTPKGAINISGKIQGAVAIQGCQ